MGKPHTPSNAVTIQCAYCRGKGRDRFGVMSSLSTCPACRGEGIHTLVPPLVYCAYCHGSGTSPTGTRNPCHACGGKGVQPQDNRTLLCPRCNGVGTDQGTHLYCQRCHGSGLVEPAN